MSNSNNSQNVINCVKRRKYNLKRIFGLKCCICGFDEFEEALEFHHVDEKNKSFGISDSFSTTKSLEAQLEETKKCILVCANCHRGIHAGVKQVPNNWQSFYNEEIAQELLEEKQNLRTNKVKHCQRCGKIIDRQATYCVDCFNLIQRKVDRPSREELKTMIRTMPFTHIAKKFGVSDNAIRKWCIAENLPKKKTEINKFSDEEWENL